MEKFDGMVNHTRLSKMPGKGISAKEGADKNMVYFPLLKKQMKSKSENKNEISSEYQLFIYFLPESK